ncbi:lipopolysaccharide assembly protein LapB [Streptomyces sp. NBC_00038]|uniref:tetratricopeptide repeat protein n=1 Tax=Streptomyces sp. NBC_00038 TaxID=2903615 RepID=UPI0022522D80|nr:tetratricopeptide repeat protein [Streptomyces sp. NBC_00038]MCX5556480.1 tetratricopeptide repeat protein [Streptomyces sp. NBC_00038]
MSPRTNDSAPESERGSEPADRAAEAMPEESPVGATGAGTGSETAAPGPAASEAGATTEADDDAVEAEAMTEAAAPAIDETATGAGDPATDEGACEAEATTGAAAPAADRTATAAGDKSTDTAVDKPGDDATGKAVTGADDKMTDTAAAEVTDETTDAVSDAVTDERVAAVRRLSASGRRRHMAQLAFCASALAVALTAGAIVVGAVRDDGGAATVASVPVGVSPQLLAGGDLDASITALQAHLRSQPRDFGSWSTLGLAYIEQARTKGDPSRYPQAQQALDRSLKLRPDNDPALAGRAALAAARHDFTGALNYADQALKQNPYSERALASRIDALVELGRYEDASKAADTADSRRPGVPVFTRYAYVQELRGDVKTARRVLEQALDTATTRGDVTYVATALGQLAWNQGEYDSALTYYARALAADDTYLPALEGRARTQAAQGDRAAAITGMEQVVERYPLPQPLVELGELYEARGKEGDAQKARDQYTLVDAWVSLARANGVNADLDTALAAADHGDKEAALKAARAEWARRHTVHTADALAWALHVNGRDEEALPYAREATATGYRNASFLYHRGMIERATGHGKEADASLKSALDLNPGFSPLGATAARKALEADK